VNEQTDKVCIDGMCAQCGSDANCKLDEGLAQFRCDLPTHACVECIGDDDCGVVAHCNVATHICVDCLGDADCSGRRCDDATHECVDCRDDTSCHASTTCDVPSGACVPTSCTDGVESGNETDVDCGGSCEPCDNGKHCLAGSDCQSGNCEAGTCGPWATAVAVSRHTCAVTTAGGLKCWGYNLHGEVGNGGTTNVPTPVDVIGLASGVATVCASAHTCVLTMAGGLKCWGRNDHGQVGDGGTADVHTPVDVPGFTSGVASVVCGGDFTCVLTTSGSVACWGGDSYGQLGDGGGAVSLVPVTPVGLGSGVTTLVGDGSPTCAADAAGDYSCWGADDGSQPTPTLIGNIGHVVAQLAPTTTFACITTPAGEVDCWGRNYYGQLGRGYLSDAETSAAPVSGLLSGMSAISTYGDHACAVSNQGRVVCWGDGGYGVLGEADVFTALAGPVAGLWRPVAAVATGDEVTCALTRVGGISCWGDNQYDGLGVSNIVLISKTATNVVIN
jgi:alpha-tubulin suppressor-like RCC1 family protein